jgi:short-subunit dehydrogenase
MPDSPSSNMAQHILITGASSGIGSALAEEMAQRGMAVGLVARRETELKELCEKINAAGGQAAWAVGDVTSLESITQAVQHLENTLGPVEILVANAGISARSLTADPEIEQLRKVMDVNYFGAIHSAKAVLPGMVERKRGHLVVISSVAGFRGLPKSAAYSSSKAAISTYWESQRIELINQGIACTSINPGYIKTPLTDKNKHPMPFLISVEKAAITMADGILSRRKVLTFPWRMRFVMGLARLLPVWLYDRLMRKAAPKYR